MIDIGYSIPPLKYAEEQLIIAQAIPLPNRTLDTQKPLVYELEAYLEAPSGAQLTNTVEPPLHDRLIELEDQISVLAAEQASPRVTLSGRVTFGLSDAVGADIDEATTFQNSIRVRLNASFTGEDRLEIGLRSGSSDQFDFNDEITREGELSFLTDTDDTGLEVNEVSYEFPLGARGNIYISTTGDDLDDFNPFLGSSATGSISEFGGENPIHSLGQDVGVQLNYDVTDDINIGVGYFADDASDATVGLFDGNYSAFAQLALEPNDNLLLGLTYLHTYNDSDLETDTGSFRSQIDLDRPVVGNSYGIAGSWEPSDKFALGGWVGYTNARVLNLGDAYILNYALTLAFPDMGKNGNLLGIIIGQEPKLMGTSGFSIDGRRQDPDTSFHIEAFYTHQISDYLSITPGAIWLTAPDHNNDNDDIFVFTVRTTFEF